MRAIVAPALGEPWELREVPDPVPAPDEVLIAVEASGVCYSDVHVLNNPGYAGTFPRILGHEVVGRVVRSGDDVTGLEPGDRVGVAWTQRWCGHCRLCHLGAYAFCEAGPPATGVTLDGGHAELMVAHAGSVERVPDAIPSEEAAPLFCAGYTVYSALLDARIRPGERVAVIGVGGLGHLALQYARGMAAHVLAVTRDQGKSSALQQLGAHEVVVASGDSGAALHERGGVDVIVTTGNAVDPDVLKGLRTGGRLAVVGVSDSPIATTAIELVFGKFTILGSSPGSRAVLGELLAFHAAIGARTLVETYPLERADEALARVAAGEVRFRAVLVPGES